jgi:glyoxylase-like metal-dependent hydrolase (beta-lactamase superfamily II)
MRWWRATLRGMQKTTVGSIEITALVDLVQSYPATTVYPGVGDTARFARHLEAGGNVPLGFASFLVRDGETLLLVDTGWGPEHGGQLLAELSAAGVTPGDVTHVLFTHLHGDHTGWNIDRETGRPIFANARYLAPKADWDHFDEQDRGESERLRERPQLGSFSRDMRPLQAAGVLDLISGESPVSKALVAIPTPGHTPGHTSVSITSGGEHGFILGDVVITCCDAEEPSLETVFDSDRQLAVRTRKATVERLIADGALVGASHLPAPGLGRFVRVGSGQEWRGL